MGVCFGSGRCGHVLVFCVLFISGASPLAPVRAPLLLGVFWNAAVGKSQGFSLRFWVGGASFAAPLLLSGMSALAASSSYVLKGLRHGPSAPLFCSEEDLQLIMQEAEELKQKKKKKKFRNQSEISASQTSIEQNPSMTNLDPKQDKLLTKSPEAKGDNEAKTLDTEEQDEQDEAIEEELLRLQAKMVKSRPYSGKSRPGTPALPQRRGMDYLSGLNNRLDSLDQQLHHTHDSLNNMMKTIMDRLDQIENKGNKGGRTSNK